MFGELFEQYYNSQWHSLDFFAGGRPGHLKATTRPQQGIRGGGARITKFKFLKRSQALENESIFQKYQHFCWPKNPFFYAEKLNIFFSRNYEFFGKSLTLANFQFLWSEHINPEKFPMYSII